MQPVNRQPPVGFEQATDNIRPLGPVSDGAARELFGQRVRPAVKDPAPSRARYRMQRLWLRPWVRKAIGKGVPLIGLIACAGYLFSDPELRDQVAEKLEETRVSFQSRPEFKIDLLKVKGADQVVSQKVRDAAGLTLPATSFAIDLDQVRTRIEALDEVKAASVFLRNGGVLEATVTPRVPVVLWRGPDGLEMLDANGVRAGRVASRLMRSDLPLIAGEGAEQNITEALEIFATAAPFATRLRGLSRVGERRWDLVLDRGQVIFLPAGDPILAVERVVALDKETELLDRDISVIDLRNGARASIRLQPMAATKLREARMPVSLTEDEPL